MFEEFRKNFVLDETRSENEESIVSMGVNATGWNEFFPEFSGRSFNNGLYRTHSVGAIQEWNDIVCIAFPEFSNQIMCFGYDWLGRQFALDLRRGKSSEPSVLMFEPGTGYALDIEVNFVEFHESEVEVQKDACLAVRFYNEWLNAGNEPLSHDTCAGYIVPLFLSGKDTIENLELSDMEVYWVVLGQVLQQVKGKS